MSLLSVVKDVCLAVGVNPLASLITPSVQPRTQAEMLSLANEMAQRIAYDAREWTMFKTTATFTGNGVTTDWPLPVDYLRMLLKSNVWRTPNFPMTFISDTDEWVQRRISGVLGHPSGEWTIYSGQMHIFPALAVGETAQFAYLHKNCISLFAGGFGDEFMNDLDRFALPERLMKLGMIWQWKANKGSPYAEDMGTYQDAILMMMGSDKPSPILIDGRPRAPIMGVPYAGTW